MALSELQQAREFFNRSTNILIAFPPKPDGDAIGSALALQLALQKIGKRSDIVSSNFNLPGRYRFLPNSKNIIGHINSLRKFIISVDLNQNQLRDVSYSVEQNKLNIYLTPKQGSFSAKQISSRSSNFLYDLIIVLNSPDLNSLGDLYLQNTEFFFNTSVINIDHNPSNEHFGQLNLIDFNVTSTAEIILKLLSELKNGLVDPDIATCLLTGLTVASKSFSSLQVTPDSLDKAAQLINLGARREEVVTHLYRTRQLNTLKLWGRVLARLKNDSQRKLVWSLLQPDDFIKAGAGEEDLPGVIDELLDNSPEAGTVVLFYELTAGQTKIFLRGGGGRYAIDLLKPFSPSGDRLNATASLSATVLEAEKTVIEHLRQIIKPLEQ